MELTPYAPEQRPFGKTIQQEAVSFFTNPFIEANTLEMDIDEIKTKHLIPVFVKENIPTISQADFITNTLELVENISGKKCSNLQVRVSHPIKGRVFEARNKRAEDLEEWEKTLYYERMAFIAELPDYKEVVNGHELTLTVGGIKAYNLDNLHANNNRIQHFKFFMGYNVRVCTNLCVSTDGFSGDIKARTLNELRDSITTLLQNYDMVRHPITLQEWMNYELNEHEFAQIIGRARIYQHLPSEVKKDLPELYLSDSQLNAVAKGYHHNPDFKCNPDGSISLWNFYNLLTEAVKSSYIDTFLDRNTNCSSFVQGINHSLQNGRFHWFLH